MEVFDESAQIKQLNEMFINVLPSLPTDIENSVYYVKLRNLLHSEIFNFCREKLDIKEDLNIFRMMVGEKLTEDEIREYLDKLKAKYNGNGDDGYISLDYHIEVTRIDYGVPVFVIIRRGNNISMKKFVYRFRKKTSSEGLLGLNISSTPLTSLKKGGK